MHAASVNPEPGSNSLKNCILSCSRKLTSSLELFILASFYFFEYLLLCFNEIFRTFQCFKISCCSIFKEQEILAKGDYLKEEFRFAEFSNLLALLSALDYYNPFQEKSQYFFQKNLHFSYVLSFGRVFTNSDVGFCAICTIKMR